MQDQQPRQQVLKVRTKQLELNQEPWAIGGRIFQVEKRPCARYTPKRGDTVAWGSLGIIAIAEAGHAEPRTGAGL